MSRSSKERPVGVHQATNLKRDNIISKARVKAKGAGSATHAGYDEAVAALEDYLLSHGKKRTPERSFILKKIYECQGPVDIQTLFRMVCDEEGIVSLATVYNNLSLLVDARLVRKLDLLGSKMAFYEKILGSAPHGYCICDGCGRVSVLDEAELLNLHPRLPRGFKVHDVVLHVHGLCQKCKGKKAERNT